MPHHARTHIDMLQNCCGICGIKKKSEQLRKISDLILEKIKSVEGYDDYDVNDDRYPKVICKEHDQAVRERYNNRDNPTYHFSKNLPSNIPKFKDICLPHVGTRANPTGFTDEHSCFLCAQNKVGRPRHHNKSTYKKREYLCSKCLQKCGPGIPHPCLKSKKNAVENISSTLLQMKPIIQNQVIYKILK